MREELPSDLYQAIEQHCRDGDAEAERGGYEAAVAHYNQAWQLVPEPKNKWKASTWVLAAIGDACFLAGYQASAREALQYAMTCPDAVGNPFLHLRLGQILFDDGVIDTAADELMRAYMGAGLEIFEAEDDRYLTFLRSRAQLD